LSPRFQVDLTPSIKKQLLIFPAVLPASILRILMCLLALCLGLQGMALSSMRAQGRSHYHVISGPISSFASTAEIKPLQALTALLQTVVPDQGQAIFLHRRAELRATPGPQVRAQASHQTHAHAHAVRASHSHDAQDLTAVWLGEDDRQTLQSQAEAPSRGLHDLDGLPAPPPVPADTSRPQAWAIAPEKLVTSLLTPPPKRPPRA
jgi:hypothetical protein